MAEIADLSTTDASNTARFPESQLVPTLNNGARALEGILARWFADTNGSIASAGTSPAYTITTNRTLTAHAAGIELKFRAHADYYSGSATVTINALAAKSLVRQGGADLLPGDIVTGQLVHILYNSVNDNYECLGIQSSATPIGTSLEYNLSTLPSDDWLWENGLTLGNASSNATGRASDSVHTKLLFVGLWTADSSDNLPIYDSAGVLTAKGGSATDDWDANKALSLPDSCGRATFGADNMGAISSKNRLTGLSGGIDGDVPFDTGGAESVTLTEAEQAVVDPDSKMTDPTHDHDYTEALVSANVVGTDNFARPGGTQTSQTSSEATGITFSSIGSGDAHNNLPPGIVRNRIIYAGIA